MPQSLINKFSSTSLLEINSLNCVDYPFWHCEESYIQYLKDKVEEKEKVAKDGHFGTRMISTEGAHGDGELFVLIVT